jgi:hypothetical protein
MSGNLEAQPGDTEEKVLRRIVVIYRFTGDVWFEPAMPESEGASPVNGLALTNQPLRRHFTSRGNGGPVGKTTTQCALLRRASPKPGPP